MKKVLVAVSGGVDSIISCHLLLKKGYKVEAIYMVNWDRKFNNEIKGQDLTTTCSSEVDYLRAKELCNKLGIKLHKVEFIEEYYAKVFMNYIKGLKLNLTPNPDILCNKFIKFSAAIKWMLDNTDCDFFSTGHYAKLESGIFVEPSDKFKDQTYFLSYIDKSIIKYLIFPLSNYKKIEVIEIAKKLKLYDIIGRESMGICFIGKRKIIPFLSNYIKQTEGNIIDYKTNSILGKHKGTSFYTIGQNKNLNLGGLKKKYYVFKKDNDKNTLYVSENKSDLLSKNIKANNLHYWIEKNKIFNNEVNLMAVARYNQAPVKVKTINIINNQLSIKLEEKIYSVTPGQVVCIYNEKKLVLAATII